MDYVRPPRKTIYTPRWHLKKAALQRATINDAEPKNSRKRSGLGIWLSRLGVLCIVCVSLAMISGLIGAHWVTQQLAGLSPEMHRPIKADRSLTVGTQDGTVIGYDGVYQGRNITPEEIPNNVRWAVLAIEDRRFYEHPGVDYLGIARAAWRNLQTREIVEGGSTITQQLVKQLFLSDERTLQRKVQEAALAMEMEQRLTKDQILTAYLNTVYFGAGAYGIDAAAHRYFDKDIQDLNLAEAAILAGLIKAPTTYDPFRNLAAAHGRAREVLIAMYRAGYVSSDAAFSASSLLPRPERREAPAIEAGYFHDYVTARAHTLFSGARGDLTVRTTLDPDLQILANKTVQSFLDQRGDQAKAGQAALVALSRDGAILAMVGGRDYDQSQFNRAAQAKRQPGSLFKGFVYLAAMENGWRPNSLVMDAPINVNGWEPQNYANQYYGRLTLASAFAKSANSVAVRLQESIGRHRVIAMARKLGLDSPLAAHASLALGTSETTLLDITGAYAAMAHNNSALQPYAITHAELRGRPVYEYRSKLPQRAYGIPKKDVMHLLRSTALYGTAARVRSVGSNIFGKTGTSQDYRDAWFVGFTDKLVVGVWVGNDDNSPMNRISGGNLPAEIWADFVSRAHDFLPEPSEPIYTAEVLEPRSLVTASTTAVQPEPEPQWVAGVPRVVSTSVLNIGGQELHLEGVAGFGGEHAEKMRRYLAGKVVRCMPLRGSIAECWMGETNLSVAVIYNGGGRATLGAPDRFQQAENNARSNERGIWQPIRRAEGPVQRTAYLPDETAP